MTAHVHQVHGGVGFALEGGIHRYYRRAKTVQVWIDALLRDMAPKTMLCPTSDGWGAIVTHSAERTTGRRRLRSSL